MENGDGLEPLASRVERGAGPSMSLGEKVGGLWTAVENGQG